MVKKGYSIGDIHVF